MKGMGEIPSDIPICQPAKLVRAKNLERRHMFEIQFLPRSIWP